MGCAKVVRSVSACGLALVLVGCPYSSSEPLTPLAASVLDARLSGAWRCLSSSEDETARVTFTPFDAQQYVIAVRTRSGKDEPGLMRAYVGKLRDAAVLSVQELGAPEESGHDWTWMRYSIVDGDLLRLRVVADEPLKSARTPAAARALVESRLDDADLFEEGLVCVRAEETSS